MHPILLQFGPVRIYSYGVMVALGYGIATLLIYRNAPAARLDKNKMVDLSIFALIGGLIGARLLYVLSNMDYYLQRPLEILYLSRGGLVWYGGFFSGLAVAIFYIRTNGLVLWQVFDLVVPYLALGQALGRVGCSLNGCCYGIKGHPAQVYSALLLVLMFIVLRMRQKRRHFEGEIFLGYCILYSLKRFFIEFVRGDNPKILSGLTLSQIIGIAVFTIALAVLIYKAAEWKKVR